MAPRAPVGVGPNPASPEITRVFVVSEPTTPGLPVRGMFSPFSAAWFRMASGVSPCATCQITSPLPRSIADSCPYGGFMIGSPCTVSPGAPPPSPAAGAATAAAAGVPGATARSPPAADPVPPVVLAPVNALPTTYARSFFVGSRGGTSPSWLSDFCEFT